MEGTLSLEQAMQKAGAFGRFQALILFLGSWSFCFFGYFIYQLFYLELKPKGDAYLCTYNNGVISECDNT